MIAKTLFRNIKNIQKYNFSSVALQGEPIQLPITKITSIGTNSKLFTLGLEQGQKIGIQTGKHIQVRTEIDGELVRRAITPVSHPDTEGQVDLLIKIYRKTEKFPEGGKLTSYLDTLNVGDSMTVQGPVGKYEYKGNGQFYFKLEDREQQYKQFVMVAGGSGITPIYQIMSHIIKYKESIPITAIVGNPNMEDILMYEELKLINQENENININFIVDRDGDASQNVKTGLITPELITELLPKGDGETGAIFCGPQPMIKSVLKGLTSHGYELDDLIKY